MHSGPILMFTSFLEESNFFRKDLRVGKGLSKNSTGGYLNSDFFLIHSILYVSAQAAHIGLMLNSLLSLKTEANASNCRCALPLNTRVAACLIITLP